MRSALKILAVAASLTLTQSLLAIPINGTLTFSGTAQLDGTTVATSTEVENWGGLNQVSTASGSFTGLAGHSVNLAPTWAFNSGTSYDFWNVGGFEFDLSLSSVYADQAGVLTVILDGNVIGNSAGPTPFLAQVQIYDPATPGGAFHYTEALEYVTTPDGGTTALLLGLSLVGLVLIRRRLPSA